MKRLMKIDPSTIIAILAFVALPMVLPADGVAKPAPFTKYEVWALNKCDHAVYRFHHPYKGLVVAEPPRSWCRWTIIALRRKDNPRAGYAARPELAKLVRLESGYSPNANNPTSTAFGLYQFLDDTWGAYQCRRTKDAVQQSVCGIRYIQKRYGSPRAALKFHFKHNWY